MVKSVAERQADFQRRLREAGGRRIAFDLNGDACANLEKIAMAFPDLKKGELLSHVLAQFAKTLK